MVKLLAGAPSANVSVVGEEEQSIYRFRGAGLSNILGFRAAYPRGARVMLTEKFRSRHRIVDAADPTDSVSCYDVATSEIFGLAAADVTRALNAASRRRMSLEAALREAAAQPETAPFARRALEVVERLLASIDRHRSMSSERTTGELLYHFMTSSGWLGRLTREADDTGDERVQNV